MTDSRFTPTIISPPEPPSRRERHRCRNGLPTVYLIHTRGTVGVGALAECPVCGRWWRAVHIRQRSGRAPHYGWKRVHWWHIRHRRRIRRTEFDQ